MPYYLTLVINSDRLKANPSLTVGDVSTVNITTIQVMSGDIVVSLSEAIKIILIGVDVV